jgi:hypothetical protein
MGLAEPHEPSRALQVASELGIVHPDAGRAGLVGSRLEPGRVRGAPVVEHSPGARQIHAPASLLLLLGVQVITGMPFADPTGGFKCFRRRTLERLELETVRSNGYSFQIEMTHRVWRQGMKVVEVPIIFTDRFQGSSKMSGHIVREALWMVWRLWFQNGLRRSPRQRPAPAATETE